MRVATLLDQLREYVSRQPQGGIVLLDTTGMNEPTFNADIRGVRNAGKHKEDFLVFIGTSVDDPAPRLTAASFLAILEALPAGSDECSVEATEGLVDLGQYQVRLDRPLIGTGESQDGSSFLLAYGTGLK